MGIVTANELHVPVSDRGIPLPTYLTMSSADTDHSFWVPRLAGKMDLIPNKVNTMWIDPQTSRPLPRPVRAVLRHAARQDADSGCTPRLPAEFAAWVAQQRQPAVQDPAAAEGREVFEHNACISCHTIAGTVATGRFGPDLTHVASRDTIASGSVPNTPANLRELRRRPGTFQTGRAHAAHAPQRSRSRCCHGLPNHVEVEE